jgi:hypothetical protein
MKFGISCEGKDLAKEVIRGKKTITRRKKPYNVGDFIEIEQVARDMGYVQTWRVIGTARVIACEPDSEWLERVLTGKLLTEVEDLMDDEAQKEGYSCVHNLYLDLKKFYGSPLPELWRIELGDVEDIKKCEYNG